METAGILALDLATWTGHAIWRPGLTSPRAGVLRLPKSGEDVGRFVYVFEQWLKAYLNFERPRYVVFEAPYVGEKTSQETARKLMGLAVVTELVCHAFKQGGADCRYLEVNNAPVRTHFLGEGSRSNRYRRPGEELRDALKRMTVETCAQKGWQVDDDNEADALAVLDFAAYTLRNAVTVPWNCTPAGSLALNSKRVA